MTYIDTVNAPIPPAETCPRCQEEGRVLRPFFGAFEPERRGRACRRCVVSITQAAGAMDRAARKHGLRAGEAYGLLHAADFRCMGCGSIGPVQLDHDHAHCPGKYGCGSCVRMWLCCSCQVKLAKCGDNPVALRASGHQRDLNLALYVEVFRDYPRKPW